MRLTLCFFGAYFLLLWFGMRTKTPEMVGGWWFFLRAFFPNWKFFHAVGYSPRLYVRYQHDEADQVAWSDWFKIYPRQKRRWTHCLHNPRVNLLLGYQNLVEHLVADLNGLPSGHDARKLVTYQLVAKWARISIAEMGAQTQPRTFQFQICMQEPMLNHPEAHLSNEVMLISEVFES